MDLTKFYNLLEQQDKIFSVEDYYELQKLSACYPYCQPIHLLFLEAVRQVKPMDLQYEIEQRSIYFTDRKALSRIVSPQHEHWANLQHEGVTVDQDKFSLIDHFLSQNEPEPFPEDLSDLLPRVPTEVAVDYTQILADKPSIQSDDEETTSIIDQFIEKESNQEFSIFPVQDTAVQEEAFTKVESAESLTQHDAFLTESLAKIYIKQKKYSKALEIIKKLSLKYPEKNVYFADQIRFIEKIITNIKTE